MNIIRIWGPGRKLKHRILEFWMLTGKIPLYSQRFFQVIVHVDAAHSLYSCYLMLSISFTWSALFCTLSTLPVCTRSISLHTPCVSKPLCLLTGSEYNEGWGIPGICLAPAAAPSTFDTCWSVSVEQALITGVHTMLSELISMFELRNAQCDLY